jgi:hypothetical protein
LLLVQSLEVRVIVAQANVRSEASATAPVLTSVSYGATIQLAEERGAWARVRVPDARLGLPDARVEGWISTCAVHAEIACAPPKSNIAVSADVPGKTQWLTAIAMRASPSPESSDASALVTWSWTIPKLAVANIPTISARQPTLFAAYGNVSGLQPTAFAPVLVRLTPISDGALLVATAAGRADAPRRDVADWTIARDLKYDIVATTPLGGNTGMIKIRPAAALPPGLYAVVLRPLFLTGYAGGRVFGDVGEGLAFGQVWAFQVR